MVRDGCNSKDKDNHIISNNVYNKDLKREKFPTGFFVGRGENRENGHTKKNKTNKRNKVIKSRMSDLSPPRSNRFRFSIAF